MVPMEIQIIASEKVKEKIEKLCNKTAIKVVEEAKITLVEQGYPLIDNRISIVFNSIDYDEVLALLVKENSTINYEEMSITASFNNRYYVVSVADILYIESQDTVLQCHIHDNVYEIKKTLSYYEQALDQYGLMRINKSQIVNLKHVKEIVPWFNSRFVLVLTNGNELEVSKVYAKALRKLLQL